MDDKDTRALHNYVIEYFQDKHVSLESIAYEAYKLQSDYYDDLDVKECLEALEHHVLMKREVLLLAVTGLELDSFASNHLMSQPLQRIVDTDDGLYGVDEHIAIGMTEPYGSIATTTYGYLDKAKHGVAKQLDADSDDKHVNTFIDDIISALIADTAAYVAHNHQ